MASVFLGDLDADVIGLGQDCTNPLFVTKPEEEEEDKTKKKKRVALTLEEEDFDARSDPNVIVGTVMRSAATTGSRATVSLSDCLACSGCVTSAETVLLSEDTVSKLRTLCSDTRHSITCAISRASLASLAEASSMTLSHCFQTIHSYLSLPPWNMSQVVTSDTAQQLAAAIVAEEFMSRLENQGNNSAVRSLKNIPEATIPISRTKYRSMAEGSNKDIEAGIPGPRIHDPLPMLCGECPGVVSYLEKNAPHVLPYLASAKSGTAIHAALEKNQKETPSKKFVAVAPCADKKLEASRRDLSDDGQIFDIDLVLTTTQLLEALGGLEELSRLGKMKSNLAKNILSQSKVAVSKHNAGSGGYLEYTYRSIAASHGLDLPDTLPYERVKNDDFFQIALTIPDRPKPLRFARAYGFRNVQKVANAIKVGNCPYHFVEIMACPSGGCLNGGGQLTATNERNREDIKRRVKRVDTIFHALPSPDEHESSKYSSIHFESPLAKEDDSIRTLLYTRFHHIPALEDTMNPGDVKW